MKILLISFNFPPQAPLAATRAPKFAKYLSAQGYDVRVLCADDPQPIVTYPLEIEPERVIRTPWRDLRALPGDMIDRLSLKNQTPANTEASVTQSSAAAKPEDNSTEKAASLRSRVGKIYDAAICRPDRRVGWKPFAIAGARRLFAEWRPDVIYATCPPHSTAVIADTVSRISGIPLIVEFRDRWGFDAYSDHPNWRRSLDQKKETEVLSRAAGIVTVSPYWARGYRERFGDESVVVSMNGFDPADYPLEAPSQDRGSEKLELLYAGALYPRRRDPSPIFEAIALLGADAKKVRVTMLGKDLDLARVAAADAGITECLDIHPPEPHGEIVKRQYASDALIMLQWNDRRDAGTVPGKLFECIAARRPVIATGWTEGVGAGIIRDRGLGIISNEPSELASHLRSLLAEKESTGAVASLPPNVRDGFTRDEQYARIEPLLRQVANTSAARLAGE